MKRTLLLAASAFALCSGAALAQDTVTLKFWDNQQTESGLSQYQQEAVKRFEAENPGIKVEVTTIPYPEYQQRLLTAVQGGNAPDVSTVDQIWVAAFAKGEAIAPLDDRAKDAGIKAETFFPGAWESANYNGKLWGIPFNVDVWSFSFHNNALFKAAGIDPDSTITWTGMKTAAEKLTDTAKGKYAVGLFAHKGEDTVVVLDSFIFSNGGKVLDDKGKCALTSPEAVGALDYLASLAPYAPKGIANASSGDMRELFLNGSLGDRVLAGAGATHPAEVEARLGFCGRHRAAGQEAGRHLRRLEPGGLQPVEEPGRGLEVHPLPDPRGRQRRGRRPHPGQRQRRQGILGQEPQGPGQDPEAAQQRRPAAAVAALSGSVGHRGQPRAGRLLPACRRRTRPRRPARRSTRWSGPPFSRLAGERVDTQC